MRQKTTLSFAFFMLLPTMVFSQERKSISGEIVVNDATRKGVEIINMTSKELVVADAKGAFIISAKPGDTLMCWAVHLNFNKKTVSESDYSSGKISIRMIAKINELDEVVINPLKAVDLRIIPTAIESKTPAERRLRTTGDFKAWHLLRIVAGGMELDPIFNKISGRTKQKKKELQIENNEHLLRKIDEQFKSEYFTEKLKIPRDNVGGFKYYIIEDSGFANAIKGTDIINTEFILSRLAETYNKMLALDEKK
ncbi:hypothetical protein [Flavobacterium sp. 3HN19-14]|uniref:hypothetical protein n=1 Tax=Flavobacterium sp. 3HN19-14 TaxID=3448133 RepID=UPI003EE24E33